MGTRVTVKPVAPVTVKSAKGKPYQLRPDQNVIRVDRQAAKSATVHTFTLPMADLLPLCNALVDLYENHVA